MDVKAVINEGRLPMINTQVLEISMKFIPCYGLFKIVRL